MGKIVDEQKVIESWLIAVEGKLFGLKIFRKVFVHVNCIKISIENVELYIRWIGQPYK